MRSALRDEQIKTDRSARKDEPHMPHERDESDYSQSSDVRSDIKQAFDDIEEGQVDTDLRGVKGIDEANKEGTNIPKSIKKPSDDTNKKRP
jgi:hypothetical protein